MILEVFKQLGKVKRIIEILNNFVKIGAITLEANLRYFTGNCKMVRFWMNPSFVVRLIAFFIDIKRKKKNF